MSAVTRCLNSGSNLPEALYRIISVERLKEMMVKNINALVSPLLWEDPDEAAPLRVKLTQPRFIDIDGSMKVGMKFIGEPRRQGTWTQQGTAIYRIYCQSWTATPETDTMWRAYSPNKECVRIRVSTTKLVQSFGDANVGESCFLGEVNYVTREEIDNQLLDGKACYLLQGRGGTVDGVYGLGWVPALTRKRLEFKPEHEYRLILAKKNDSAGINAPRFHSYDFESKSLIEEVTLDPRSAELNGLTQMLRDLGYSGTVNKSNLYQVPEYDYWNSTHPR